MKVIFAQGNPDPKYQKTRHNTGFLALDAFANKHSAVWRDNDTYKSRISTVMIRGEKIMLVKPLSYYNDTGLVARKLSDYYKLDPVTDFLVIHDDLALPLGTVRIRERGSDAGNNGIKSLNAHLGPLYTRIRVGIATEDRERIDDVNFVLSVFPKAEMEKLEKNIIPHVIELTEDFIDGKLALTSTKIQD